jgi:uncharacterized membrane protein YfcA
VIQQVTLWGIHVDPSTLLMIMAACFGAAVLSGMSGFGGGLIITLFITPIIGAKAVVPVLAVAMGITNLSRVWFFRTALNPRIVALLAGPGAVAAVLGSMLYVRLDPSVVQALLGIVLIGSMIPRHYLAKHRISPNRTVLVGIGGLYGFLSSVVVGAGIILVPTMLGAGLAGAALLATDAAIAVLINIVKIFMFGTLDALTLKLFIIALLMGACTVPGTWLASCIVKRTNVRIHTMAMEVLIICGGGFLLIDSLLNQMNG